MRQRKCPTVFYALQEIADVMNYVLHSWGNESDAMVTPEEVTMNTNK
jgi:hypothetical protein